MNKSELVEVVAQEAGISKNEASKILDCFVETISDELAKGGTVQLVGFGTFKVGERAERTGRNPKTGEPLTIPATKTPKFIPGKSFKEIVNK